MDEWSLPKQLSSFKQEHNLVERIAKVEEFNKNNKFKKRGLGVSALRYGMSRFYTKNAHAYISANPDGI